MRRHVYFCVSEAIYTPLGGVGSGKYVNKKEDRWGEKEDRWGWKIVTNKAKEKKTSDSPYRRLVRQ